MRNYIQTLYNELKQDLDAYAGMGILPIRKLSGSLDILRNTLADLKDYILKHPFHDPQDEIAFFKEEKPLLVAEQLYAQEIYNIETKRPLTGQADLRAFYKQELRFIELYLGKHEFLYQYYLLAATELDNLLFVRGAGTSSILLPEMPDLDPSFSTKGDHFFAKFMAYERLREYLHRELYPSDNREKLKRALNWTGDKMNLIEIAYGIYDTAQINKGEVHIVDIVTWLEDSLNISLHRHYRMFSEMKNRKSVSATCYLDHMVEMVKQHLTEGDAFRPTGHKIVIGSKSSKKK